MVHNSENCRHMIFSLKPVIPICTDSWQSDPLSPDPLFVYCNIMVHISEKCIYIVLIIKSCNKCKKIQKMSWIPI